MIYLDNAATTLKKPPAVGSAARWAMGHAAGAGRSAHFPAMTGAEILYDTRALAAELFGMEDPRRVVFTFNATHALCLALHSMSCCLSQRKKPSKTVRTALFCAMFPMYSAISSRWSSLTFCWRKRAFR